MHEKHTNPWLKKQGPCITVNCIIPNLISSGMHCKCAILTQTVLKAKDCSATSPDP